MAALAGVLAVAGCAPTQVQSTYQREGPMLRPDRVLAYDFSVTPQEVQLDRIAVKLGRDPAELRLQQLVPAHSLTANWMRVETIGLRQCIEKVVENVRDFGGCLKV